VASVYQLGYQQGIIDFSRDPVEKRKELLHSILKNFGNDICEIHVQSGENVAIGPKQVIDSIKSYALYDLNYKVPKQVINAAKSYVLHELDKSIQRHIIEEVGPDSEVTTQMIFELLNNTLVPTATTAVQSKSVQSIVDKVVDDEDYVQWKNANNRMGRGSVSWSMILIKSDIPNAFVSELIPQTIFITTGILQQVVSNDDELALLLGHELSHLILGHNSEQNSIQTLLSTLEIILLSLDPTEGLASLAVITSIREIKSSLVAAHSRINENEADALGLKLTAMSCFDTERATEVFSKIAQSENEMTLGSKSENVDVGSNFQRRMMIDTKKFMNMNSHPPTMQRYEALKVLSKQENADAYCWDFRKKFWFSFKKEKTKQRDDSKIVLNNAQN